MKLTNRLNLPGPIVEAIANSGYDPGSSDITATGLIEPARIGALKHRYKEQMQEDAADLIYSLQGQSVHTILERAGKRLEEEFGYVVEQRFYATILGWKVGGQVDCYLPSEGLLQDYKVTSVYAVKDGAKAEHEQQLNIQAELLRRNGHSPKKLQIVAILRDWSKGEYSRELTRCRELGITCRYPEHQVAILDVELIPSEMVVGWMEARVTEHQEARKLSDDKLPLCSDEDRWARPSKWAVIEKGKSRATKLCDTEEAAQMLAEEKGPKFVVEHRPGEAIRCASYCPVSKFCSQYNGGKK